MKKTFSIRAISAIAMAIGALSVGAANAQYIDLDGAVSMPSSIIKTKVENTVASQFQGVTQSPQDVTVMTGSAPSSELAWFEMNKGKLTQVGVPKGEIGTVKAFGKEIRLMDALKIAVPVGWHAKKVGQVDLQQKVVFGAASSWLEAIGKFAEQTQNAFEVDWDQKTVTVTGTPKTVMSSGFIKLAGTNEGAIGQGETPGVSTAASTASPPVLAPTQTWDLVAGKSLRDNLEDWAAKAKPAYTVEWRGVNYMIKKGSMPGDFTGAFDDDERGPVVKIIKAFENNDVTLKATFLEDNRVLLVENAHFRTDPQKLNPFGKFPPAEYMLDKKPASK